MKTFLRSATFLLFLFGFQLQPVKAQPAYEARRSAYIDTALANPNNNMVSLQAFRGVPVDSARLKNMIDNVPTRSTADFVIVHLVRTMFQSNGEYDSIIKLMLDTIPLTLQPNDTLRSYWSENHLCMWNSSYWLLHERWGIQADSALRDRLVHYLKLKNKYGYYEFFSPTYAPYSLTGLLNLADFAQDIEIKTLATSAAQRLLAEYLLFVNDKGVSMAAAGRAFHNKYRDPYNQNHYNLMWMLTGLGPAPKDGSHAGVFLATTTVPMADVINSWTAQVDTVLNIGHSIDSGRIINGAALVDFDRILFQWSSGTYFHPKVAIETATLIDDYNLWEHVDFTDFSDFSFLDPSLAENLANFASSASKSSVIAGQNVSLFKSNAVTLSSAQSLENLWAGKAGYQQFPVMGNVGTTAVYLSSGEVKAWNNRSQSNDHLPHIEQKSNVALVMYRPEPGLKTFGFGDWDVSLYWPDNEYDEIVYNGNWVIGRQDEGYVAVRRHCTDSINGLIACPEEEGQTWVIMVGDSGMYGNFSAFQNVVSQAQFETAWYTHPNATDTLVYYSKIVVDGDSVEYEWLREVDTTTGINNAVEQSVPELKVYPNPADDRIVVEVEGQEESVTIRIVDVTGRQHYFQPVVDGRSGNVSINTNHWPAGMYVVILETSQGIRHSKLILR